MVYIYCTFLHRFYTHIYIYYYKRLSIFLLLLLLLLLFFYYIFNCFDLSICFTASQLRRVSMSSSPASEPCKRAQPPTCGTETNLYETLYVHLRKM